MSGKEMTTEKRLKARQLYATQLADVLGLSPGALDEMKQAQRTKAIEEAVARLKSERTDAQVLAREAFDVSIGGRTYTVRVLSFRESKAYRVKLGEVLERAFREARKMMAPEGGGEIDLEHLDFKELIGPALRWLFAEGTDDFVDLMLAYQPEMAANRDAILDADGAEVTNAAFRVLEFNLPLIRTALTQLMGLISRGSAATTTAGAGR